MNCKRLEKAILAPCMNSVIELSIFNSKNKTPSGRVYILYNSMENCIKIGFTDDLLTLKLDEFRYGYNLLEYREGSNGELRIIKATLSELGHQQLDTTDCYKISNKLIRNLKTLGWPLGDLKDD